MTRMRSGHRRLSVRHKGTRVRQRRDSDGWSRKQSRQRIWMTSTSSRNDRIVRHGHEHRTGVTQRCCSCRQAGSGRNRGRISGDNGRKVARNAGTSVRHKFHISQWTALARSRRESQRRVVSLIDVNLQTPTNKNGKLLVKERFSK